MDASQKPVIAGPPTSPKYGLINHWFPLIRPAFLNPEFLRGGSWEGHEPGTRTHESYIARHRLHLNRANIEKGPGRLFGVTRMSKKVSKWLAHGLKATYK